jgi:hypothetical protein
MPVLLFEPEATADCQGIDAILAVVHEAQVQYALATIEYQINHYQQTKGND